MTDLQVVERVDISSTTDMILDHKAMMQMQSLAEMMAQGKTTVPKHLQGYPADCMAIVMQAAQWQMSPYAVAQKTHLINGVLGYEAQLVNAVVSSSKAITGVFKYEYAGSWPNGKDACVRCGAVIKGDVDITWGEWLYPATVTTKNSPLWKSQPKQQAAYLAVKYWTRLYTPAVILGVYSSDELEPIKKKTEKVINQPVTQSDTLNSLIGSNEAIEESNISKSFTDFLEEIKSAENPEQLKSIGEEIKQSFDSGFLSEEQRQNLLTEYKHKKFKKSEKVDLSTGELINEPD